MKSTFECTTVDELGEYFDTLVRRAGMRITSINVAVEYDKIQALALKEDPTVHVLPLGGVPGSTLAERVQGPAAIEEAMRTAREIDAPVPVKRFEVAVDNRAGSHEPTPLSSSSSDASTSVAPPPAAEKPDYSKPLGMSGKNKPADPETLLETGLWRITGIVDMKSTKDGKKMFFKYLRLAHNSKCTMLAQYRIGSITEWDGAGRRPLYVTQKQADALIAKYGIQRRKGGVKQKPKEHKESDDEKVVVHNNPPPPPDRKISAWSETDASKMREAASAEAAGVKVEVSEDFSKFTGYNLPVDSSMSIVCTHEKCRREICRCYARHLAVMAKSTARAHLDKYHPEITGQKLVKFIQSIESRFVQQLIAGQATMEGEEFPRVS